MSAPVDSEPTAADVVRSLAELGEQLERLLARLRRMAAER